MEAQIGNIGEYEEGREDWTQYAERLDHFLAANGITDAAKKKAAFLAVIGPKAYKLLGSLVAPGKPGDKSYADVVKLMSDHHNPKPSEIVQRYKFHTLVQEPRLPIAKYVAELRSLGQTCGFGGMLEVMIRDRLVCGINDDRIQRRLLSETALDFKKAFEIALSMETAEKNARELQSQRCAAGSLPRTRTGIFKVTPEPCYRCGKPDHKSALCPFKSVHCHNCGKVGHLQRVCRGDRTSGGKYHKGDSQGGLVRTVQEGIEDSIEHSPVLNQVVVSSSKPILVELELDGRSLTMELDTGVAVSLRNSNAGVNSITQDLLRRATQGSGPEGSGGAC